MSEARTVRDAETGLTYFPIVVTSLCADVVTDFDLYWIPQKRQTLVLYRHRDLPFSKEARGRLAESRVEELYVDAGQGEAYRRYLERNLKTLLTDDSVDLATKSAVLYSTARSLVKDVLEDPRAGTTIQRSREFVEGATDFMLRERAALESLMKVSSFDYYTYSHSVNVFVFSVSLALGEDIDTPMVKRYAMGALLHDIGKSEIDPEILHCKGKLSVEQWRIMKLHPVYGCEILQGHGVTDEIVLDVTRHHHEKLSGTGYPDGLEGDAISEFVRISTIADIFDALTTRRPYKDAMPSFPALSLMKREMVGEIDSGLFGRFVMMVGNPTT